MNAENLPGFQISLRPESSEDGLFLFQLYADTREAELNATGWDPATRHAFLEMQWRLQREGYRSTFPSADYSIILSDGGSIGRMVLDRGGQEFRLVDIALLSEFRGKGIGTRLLKNVLLEAGRLKKPVRLHSLKTGRQITLYERLGFSKTGDNGLYEEMIWKPTTFTPD